MSETLVEHSALSIVDGRPWDMHRPLEGDCELQLKSFHDLDPFHVNKVPFIYYVSTYIVHTKLNLTTYFFVTKKKF